MSDECFDDCDDPNCRECVAFVLLKQKMNEEQETLLLLSDPTYKPKQRPDTSWEASGLNWQFVAFYVLGMLVLLITGAELHMMALFSLIVTLLTTMTAVLFYLFYKGKGDDQ